MLSGQPGRLGARLTIRRAHGGWSVVVLAALCLTPAAWCLSVVPEPPAAESPLKHALAEPGWVSWSPASGQGSAPLRGWWSPAQTQALQAVQRPAVVLLHGCGGMVNSQGQPTARMRDYAQLLNQRGWHTLAVDSLTPRGEKELCTQRMGTRRVTQVERRADALSALDWLASQPAVDGRHLALLGWSHGGSAVLAANNLAHPQVAAAQARNADRLRLAVAFYPGCAADARRSYQPLAPTLLLLGEADDWTPAANCQPLASDRVRVHTWAGAYHGFDSRAPVRLRTDVPNGVNPGQGVHVGGHSQARSESQRVLVEALTQAFAP